MGTPDLGLAHVLVVDQDVRHGRGDGGVEHAVDGHVQRGLHKDEDADVLVLDVEGRGDLDAVRDQPGVVLLDHGLRGLAGDLRVPVESAVGEHLGDLVAVVELADHPGDEAVHQARPDGLAAKGAVVAVHKLLKLVAALLPVDAAEDAVRQAGGLDDVEALQDGGLVGHQLPQEQFGLDDVALAHGRAVAGDVLEHASRDGGRKSARIVLNKHFESPKRFHARKKKREGKR